jgi:hypothetical protein
LVIMPGKEIPPCPEKLRGDVSGEGNGRHYKQGRTGFVNIK